MSPDADRPALHIEMPGWAMSAPVQQVMSVLSDARFVGGAVRDYLMGRSSGMDIDIATPLRPDEVIARLDKAGIRNIPTGIDHGTVTALVTGEGGNASLEITTLRRDVRTDGRHAEIAFTDQWREDAARRDFTFNALYLDQSGGVWDYYGGLKDCHAGRVRFIGKPQQRIHEDFLRVLRFYRFLAQLGRTSPNAEARKACRDAGPDLPRLSGERIRVELLKLLAASGPVPVLTMMIEDGVWTALFPGFDPQTATLARLLAFGWETDPVLRLAALLPDNAGITIAARLKSPNAERDRLHLMTSREDRQRVSLDADDRAIRAAVYRLGIGPYRDLVLLLAARAAGDPNLNRLLTTAEEWTPPSFPLRGADLVATGVTPGPVLGKILQATEDWWIGEDFRPDSDACLAFAKSLA